MHIETVYKFMSSHYNKQVIRRDEESIKGHLKLVTVYQSTICLRDSWVKDSTAAHQDNRTELSEKRIFDILSSKILKSFFIL